MSSDQTKPLVLVAGATGNTGQRVVASLLSSGAFRIAALTRPKSQSKPILETLKSQGVEIHAGDFVHDSVEDLQRVLTGVDILLSIVSSRVLFPQKNLFRAAKAAGVKRVIPCDFGTVCPPGRRHLQDEKFAMRSFVRELGVPYTFIDIGWWMELILPHPTWSKADWLIELSRHLYGPGNVKTAVTSVSDIGRFISRIITDTRTINQYIFCWSEEVTLDEVFAIADRGSGENLSALKIPVPEEEIVRRAAQGKADFEREHTIMASEYWIHYEYAYSLYVCGDNTLDNAKALGALDARELYPDFKPMTLEEYAKEFYTELPSFTLNV